MHHIKQNPGAPNSQHIQYQGESFTLKSFFLRQKHQTLFERERPISFWLTHFLFQIGLQSDPIYRGNFVKLSPQEHCENEIKCLKVKGRGKLLKGEIERVNREIKLGITLGKQRGQNFKWQILK